MAGKFRQIKNITKWFWCRGGIIYVPVAILGFFAPANAQETPIYGLSVTVYNNYGYNGSPPLPDQSGRPIVGTTTVENADQNFDANPPFNMYEDFIVKFDGHITAPISGTIQFLPTGDDGTKLFIDGILVDNNWRDKGGGGNPTDPILFTAGESKSFTLWFYENGGGAWVKLYWNIGNGWEVVPASAFTQTIVIPTTTTTTLAPYLNPPQNIAVTEFDDSSVHLTWTAPEQSNVEVERYAVSWSTDNFVSNGWGIASTETSVIITGLDSGTNYQFRVRADNDSLGVYSQWGETASVSTPTTTTTTTSTTTTTTTTTTTIPETTTTWVPETTSTAPETTSTTTAPTTTVLVTTTLPPTTTTTTTTSVPPTTTTSTTTSSLAPTTTTTTAPSVNQVLETEDQEQIIDNLLSLDEEELSAVIESINFREVSIEAITAIFSEEVLSELTDEQVTQLIESIAPSELTDEQALVLSEALTNAPPEIKEQFEQEINVFGGTFDTYVPTGSTISVGERRVIVAVSAVIVIAPAPVISRRK